MYVSNIYNRSVTWFDCFLNKIQILFLGYVIIKVAPIISYIY